MIVLSSPSGAGKTSLSRELLKENKNLFLSISHTTRPPRSLEVNENDYFFVSDEKFIEMLNQGEFLEHAKVFAEALEANLKAGEMHSDVPVQVQDIDRRINADSMKVYDNGARIVFGGAAKMIIKNSNAIAPTSKTVDTPKTTKAKS